MFSSGPALHKFWSQVFQVSAGAVALTCSGLYLTRETWLLDYRRKAAQQYEKNGVPKKMSEPLQNTVVDTIKTLKLSKTKMNSFKFFCCKDDEFFAGGSFLTSDGVMIGIPDYFNFTSLEDVNKEQIKPPRNGTIDWSSRVGQKLRASYILSEDAKKFAIAQKYHSLITYRVYYQTLGIAIIAAVPVIVWEYGLNNYKELLMKQPRLQFAVVLMAYVLSGLAILTLDNRLDAHYEKVGIEKAANLRSPQFLNGGIEYYEKLIKRNKAWRKLLRKEGEDLYTPDGSKRSFMQTFAETDKLALLRKIAKVHDLEIDSQINV